jgi:DNA-binding MarR family transcriptional regulator
MRQYMVDDDESYVPSNNIRSLLQDVTDGLDARLEAYRTGTRFENIRPSDVRVFVLALRQPRSLAELARILQVSRQAVHSSVNRLRQLKIVELRTSSDNAREKRLHITDRGESARYAAKSQVRQLEAECAEVIGKDGLETLRALLQALEDVFAQSAVKRPRKVQQNPSLRQH